MFPRLFYLFLFIIYLIQINHRNNLPIKKTLIYAIRFVAVCILFEWTIHYMYVNAIIRRRAYENFTPFDFCMIAYFSLNNVWLKVNILLNEIYILYQKYLIVNFFKLIYYLYIYIYIYIFYYQINYQLLIIWRFFRLWAMADNIETIENMNRCMSNNYSMAGFWRAWHTSYNKWNIR